MNCDSDRCTLVIKQSSQLLAHSLFHSQSPAKLELSLRTLLLSLFPTNKQRLAARVDHCSPVGVDPAFSWRSIARAMTQYTKTFQPCAVVTVAKHRWETRRYHDIADLYTATRAALQRAGCNDYLNKRIQHAARACKVILT